MFHAKHLGRAQVPRAEKSHADGPGARGPGARGPGARVRRSRGSDGNAGSLGVAVRFPAFGRPAFRSALVEASLQRVGIEPVARILSPELGHEPS